MDGFQIFLWLIVAACGLGASYCACERHLTTLTRLWRMRGHKPGDINCVHWTWDERSLTAVCPACLATGGFAAERRRAGEGVRRGERP